MVEYLIFFLGSLVMSLTGILCLKSLTRFDNKFLRKYFLVFSGKSSSGAQLLGGLPIALTVISMSLLTDLNGYEWTMGGKSLAAFIGGALIIATYGYLDDRYELRPIAKLLFQIMAVSYFSLVTSLVFGSEFSSFMFIGLFFYGMGVLNGTNLLDGLDTMTIKISSVVYMTYLWTGVLYNSDSTIFYSLICLGSLLPFYVFNRYPSSMHLGEVGGTFIGFSYLLLFNSLFKDLRFSLSFVDSFILCVFPMTISMCEVGISFIRRLLNEKTPFAGDKFHLHHIFTNYYKLSAPTVTTLFAFVYGGALMAALSLFAFSGLPIMLGYIALIGSICAFQFKFGQKHWISRKFDFSLRNLLKSLRKEDIKIIDNSKVDSFEFKVIHNEEQDDEKKAA